MTEYVLPVVYTLFVWWFSTGVIMLLDGLPRPTHRWSLFASTSIALVALFVLARGKNDATVTGVYVAFTCAILIWGWVEMSFLAGFVTGPRRHACVPGCSGWPHFRHAIEAILYHELSIIGCACAVFAATWDGANQVGPWTFVVLWSMRVSAKLNLFLGVRNLSEELLPPHLAYLQSFFARRRMNLLFPVAVTVATIVDALLLQSAVAPDASPAQMAGDTLLATLLGLAILEHWLMVVPVPTAALWKWSLRGRRASAPAARP